MIIALEGVAATGKTTTALHLVEHSGAVRIPEVNLLFPTRPHPESEEWYCARQVDRWALAQQASSQLVVLDGDPYHPIWFSWIYPERGHDPWWKHLDYFEESKDSISLPAFYVYLYIDADERYRREAFREASRGHHEARMQAKYERYEDMLGPQRAYFSALNREFSGWVIFLKANNVAVVSASLLAHQPAAIPEMKRVFGFMRHWLNEHDPHEFR